MKSTWNTDSKTDQDFNDWTKINGVMDKKLEVGQFLNLHGMSVFHWVVTTPKSEKNLNLNIPSFKWEFLLFKTHLGS